MADETTTQEENILPDVDPTSMEQLESDLNAATEVDEVNSKFVTKTNQKIADMTKLTSYALRGIKPQQISEEDPDLARRLSRHKEFESLFASQEEESLSLEEQIKQGIKSEMQTAERGRQKQEAMNSFRLDGKPLGSGDIKKLNENPKFTKSYDSLIEAGFTARDAFNSSFALVHPNLKQKVVSSGSILATSAIDSSPSDEEQNLSPADRAFLKKRKDRDKKLGRR